MRYLIIMVLFLALCLAGGARSSKLERTENSLAYSSQTVLFNY